MVSLLAPIPTLLSNITRRKALAQALPVAITMAGGVLLAWTAARLFHPEAEPIVALAAVATAIVAVLGVGAFVWLRAPAQRRVAARLDRQFDLKETLSTAVGLSDPDEGPISRALARHAAEVAAALDPRDLVPIGNRATVLSVAFLLVSAIAAGLVVLAPARVTTTQPEMSTAQAEAPVTEDEVEALAQLLAEDALRQDSDYLAAVAHSVEQLAEDLKQGRSSDAVSADLEALLEHARAGYGAETPDWLQDSTGEVGNVLAQASSALAAEQKARETRTSAPGGDTPTLDMYELARQRTEENAELAAANAPADLPTPEGAGGGDAEPAGSDDFAASPMQSQDLQQVGSFSAGGAAQSGKGESNAAGGGSQPLLDDSGFLQSMPDPTVDMALTAADQQEDGHIRLFVPTSAAASDSTGTVGSAANYARLAAQTVDRQSVGGDALPIVARYFNNKPAEGEAP